MATPTTLRSDAKLGKSVMARRLLMQRSLEICPQLKDKLTVDQAMNIVTKKGPPAVRSETPRMAPAPGPTLAGARGKALAADPNVVLHALNYFVQCSQAQYGQELHQLQEAHRRIAEQEAAVRQRCVEELSQHIALIARGNERVSIEALVAACAPLVESTGLSPRELHELILEAVATHRARAAQTARVVAGTIPERH